jgi:predicted O-methyltransferase YrrM
MNVIIEFIKMLRRGLVTKVEKDEDTTSIHNLNQKIHKDERVDNSLLPLADGLNVVRKI